MVFYAILASGDRVSKAEVAIPALATMPKFLHHELTISIILAVACTTVGLYCNTHKSVIKLLLSLASLINCSGQNHRNT